MSWDSKRHLARIFNAFKRNKERIYKEDIEALKSLDELINDNSKSITTGNLIFAKLLCLYLKQNANYYKGVKMAVKGLQNELKKPLDYHLQMLTKELNNIELINYFESKGIDLSNGYSEKVIKQEDEQDIINKLKNEWTYEIVEKSFYNSANDLLKDIENYT